MIKKKRVLAIIIARKNSKRLKNKNILKINKKTLLEIAYNTAKKSKYIDEIILSTESTKIKNIAKSFGLKTPFLRPKELSYDKISANKVILYTIQNYKKNFFYVLLLQPTSPLRTSNDIDKCLEKINKYKLKSIISIYKSKTLNKFRVNILNSKFIKKTKKKTINKYNYFINGAIYVSEIKNFKLKKKFLSNNTGFFLMPEYRSIDIDYKEDYLKAQKYFKND